MANVINWETLYLIGAVLLGLGLAWGLFANSRRNRRNDPLTDAATRANYDNASVDESRETTDRLDAEVRK
jgi:HAMP domain-containing protein